MALKTKGLQGAVNHEYEDYRKRKWTLVVIVRYLIVLMLFFCLFQTTCSYFLEQEIVLL